MENNNISNKIKYIFVTGTEEGSKGKAFIKNLARQGFGPPDGRQYA